MLNARIMDKPEDYKKLGVNPDKVELWEEGRRATSEAGHNEVWYFDAQMEDGAKAVFAFRPKLPEKTPEVGDSPNVMISLTPPDGRELSEVYSFTVEESTTGQGDGCDLRYGKCTVKGDFKQYDIHIEPIKGLGANLHYEALVEPFRQGTAVVAFGDNDELFHTDLSVPKNLVTGTLFYDGKEHQVKGVGYHDHQWMNSSPMLLYHHWFWGRMYTDKFTLYIYDFVTNEKYGFKRIPMFGLMDAGSGELVFKTDGQFTLSTKLEPQSKMGREFPKVSNYVFKNTNGKQVDFNVTWQDELETRDMVTNVPEAVKKQYEAANIAPMYMRYYAKGDITFTDPTNNLKVTSSGEMIYEYAYFGHPDERAHV